MSALSGPAAAEPLPQPPLPISGLTAEEATLLKELRAKYAANPACAPQVCNADAPTTAAAAPLASNPGGSCRMCGACQGSGKVMEVYGHRLIERACSDCSSDGVQQPSAPGSTAGAASAGTAASVASRGRGGQKAGRLAAHEQELAELKRSLAGCSDEQEVRLRGDLITQLEREVARLRGASQAATA